MAELKEQIQEVLKELRANSKERKFDQTVDFGVNLQKYSFKKNPINTVINVPYVIKDKKICAFLEVNNENIDTITPAEFKKYGTNKKEVKKLVEKYDFFIAQASVMPKVASTFGKVLGPAGKMPSPQMGIIMNADDKTINELKEKINKSLKIRVKEASIKVPVGKQSMKDEEIIENILAVYTAVLNSLPRNKVNVKNIQIKFTMSKPHKIKIE